MRSWLIAMMLCAVTPMGCGGKSEDELRREFEEFVQRSNDCSEDSECVLASAGCPLGCYTAVHRDHEAAVEKKAKELIEEFEESCEYECVAPGPIECIEGKCSVQPSG